MIVLAPVNPGAQLMADGHIHVYAPLRGRAVAGVRGCSGAQIFCQRLEAELVGIDAAYIPADELPVELLGKPARSAATRASAADRPVRSASRPRASGAYARVWHLISVTAWNSEAAARRHGLERLAGRVSDAFVEQTRQGGDTRCMDRVGASSLSRAANATPGGETSPVVASLRPGPSRPHRVVERHAPLRRSGSGAGRRKQRTGSLQESYPGWERRIDQLVDPRALRPG